MAVCEQSNNCFNWSRGFYSQVTVYLDSHIFCPSRKPFMIEKAAKDTV